MPASKAGGGADRKKGLLDISYFPAHNLLNFMMIPELDIFNYHLMLRGLSLESDAQTKS